MSADTAAPRLPAEYIPRIHRAEVIDAAPLGPGMIRVVFGGDDLHDYPSTGIGDEYVRMFFPDSPSEEVRLPRITSVRGWEYPEGVEPSEMRVYTIRAHEPGRVSVDFVVHDGGVAASWAREAQPGRAVGINPPCDLYDRPAGIRRQILVADEPGMPAALRLAETTPVDVETVLLLETRDAQHRLLADREGLQYVWLDGSGNGNGTSESRLLAALDAAEPDAGTYVWASTEGRLNRAIRRHLRHERGLPAENYKCVAYWQERAEDWRARYDAQGPDFAARLQAARASAGQDGEALADAIETIYVDAGL